MKITYFKNEITAERVRPVFYNGQFLYNNIFRVHAYRDGDFINYTINGDDGHRVKIQLLKWARGLHGNAPSGTQYGYFRVAFPDGRRLSIPLYI